MGEVLQNLVIESRSQSADHVTTESAAAVGRAAPPPSSRVTIALCAAFAGLAVLPLVVAVIALVGDRWQPVSDHALEILRIRDVGGSHTPLVGAYSRFGWNHPGPLLFWILAVPYRLFGEFGLLAGAATINAAALAGAIAVAWRRDGLPLVIFVAAGCAVLCRAVGPELLIDPWNAWIPVVPFLLYTLLAWSLAERDWVALPWMIGVGSFVVQAHFAYAPLVVGLGLCAAVLATASHGRRDDEHPGESNGAAVVSRSALRNSCVVAALVGAVLWLPPLLQQLTGQPGNLGELIDAARNPEGSVTGWQSGFGLMGTELGVPGPLATGDDAGFLGLVHSGSTARATTLVAVTGLLGAWAYQRGARSAGRLAALAVVSAGLGVVAASRISGLVAPYVLRWAWVVATLIWLSLFWSVWSLVRRTKTMALGLVAIAALSVVVLTALNVASGGTVSIPAPTASRTVSGLAPSAASHLRHDKEYLVKWIERDYFVGLGPGIVLELSNRGYQVEVPRKVAHQFGHRDIGNESSVDGTLTIVGGAAELGWTPPPGAVLVGSYDPLTRSERAHIGELRSRVENQVAVMCGGQVSPLSKCALEAVSNSVAAAAAGDRLAEYAARGDPYVVYLR